MKIQVYERSVWGRKIFYFRSREHLEKFQVISGQTTLKKDQIEALKFFGLEFEIEYLPEHTK